MCKPKPPPRNTNNTVSNLFCFPFQTMTTPETMPGKEQQVFDASTGTFRQNSRKPVELSGAIDHLRFEDLTPAIGREYYDVDIVDDLMNAENSDDRLRDLALAGKAYQE
jgi:hypothetical protein